MYVYIYIYIYIYMRIYVLATVASAVRVHERGMTRMILDTCLCCAQQCNYRGEKHRGETRARSTRGNYLKEYVSKLLEKTCESIGADAAGMAFHSVRACVRASPRKRIGTGNNNVRA